jgi:hypothetical protein
MKNTAFSLILVLFVSACSHKTESSVTAAIKGKAVEFSPEVRAHVVQKSVDLLSSCIYTDAKPKWGTPGEPESMADAQKESHLRLVFSTPRKVEVPVEKVTVQVREMVITLPLMTGGIWVRTENGIIYFAKYDYTIEQELQKLLKEAQMP